jgi:drug/metabolite transporter (DMT)-like permease
LIDALAYGLLAAGLVLGIWAGIQARRRLPTDDALMIAAIVLEVALLVQSGIALARLSGAHLDEPVTFAAYAVGILLPMPLGFYLARIERTRWGSIILAFTAVVVAVMTLRLLQIWRSDGV